MIQALTKDAKILIFILNMEDRRVYPQLIYRRMGKECYTLHNLCRFLNQIENEGLIISKRDGRNRYIILTEKGYQFAKKLKSVNFI